MKGLFIFIGILAVGQALALDRSIVNPNLARTSPHDKIAAINMELGLCQEQRGDLKAIAETPASLAEQLAQFKKSHLFFCGKALKSDIACHRQRELYNCYLEIYHALHLTAAVKEARELGSKVDSNGRAIIPEAPPVTSADR